MNVDHHQGFHVCLRVENVGEEEEKEDLVSLSPGQQRSRKGKGRQKMQAHMV